MNIVILGAGNIGSYLAASLSEEGHNIVVIDTDPKALERAALSADIATKLGSGTDWHVLEEIKDIHPDFFIALSSDDETNLTACAIAKSLGYGKTVARIRQESFLDNRVVDFNRLFSVDHIIGTELIIAKELYRCIINPGNIAVEHFANDAVQMKTVVMPSKFSGLNKPLSSLSLTDGLLIALIRRKMEGGKTKIIFPKGLDCLLEGDEVTFIGKTGEIKYLHDLLGLPQKEVRSVVLVGGSGVAVHLAKMLEARKIKVKIIETDEARCKQLARQFPSALILNHDGTDPDFLNEENVGAADVFIACTQNHETNIVSAITGKQAGCPAVIALVSDERVIPLLRKFDISYSLSERASIERRVQVILHHDTYLSLASLYENKAKIMEVRISEGSKLIGIPLAQLSAKFPKNFLVAMVRNGSGITIPKGSSTMAAGDMAIVICCPESVKDVESLI